MWRGIAGRSICGGLGKICDDGVRSLLEYKETRELFSFAESKAIMHGVSFNRRCRLTARTNSRSFVANVSFTCQHEAEENDDLVQKRVQHCYAV